MTPVPDPAPDPFDPAVVDDPYPRYAALRAADPVHWSARLRSWVLLRHDDVSAALRDDARLSADRLRGRTPRSLASAEAALRTVSSDPPDCLPVRAILAGVLAPRVRVLQARIDALVGGLLDDVARAGQAGDVDLVSTLAYPLPIAVIAELLGVPDGDRAQFAERSRAIARGMDRFYGGEEAGAALREIGAYFLALLAERRDTPGDDLVRALLAAEHRGERLTDLEVVAVCSALVFGGHETTVNLIANGMLALLRHPDALARLHADASLVPSAVEELLRYDGPAQIVSRTAITDLALRGRTIRAGDRVLLALGAANRDPAAFADPDTLDPARAPNPHVGFGLATHVCPGAQLARLEARTVLTGLLARFPRLRLGDAPVAWRPTIVLRGLERLPVRVD